jgi:hypothetical protein
VLRPRVSDISYFDFQKRTDIAFRGNQAVQKHMPELRNLVGLPPQAESSGVTP